jgi:(p)ppGpp synthase/HD superfamily hydrolase
MQDCLGVAPKTDPEAFLVGILHDLLDDADVQLADLARDYGERFAAAVDCLTRRTGEAYDDHITRVISNPLASRVKEADILDNMTPSRTSNSAEDSFRRERYTRALTRLRAARPGGL